jgi:hypothetical protein
MEKSRWNIIHPDYLKILAPVSSSEPKFLSFCAIATEIVKRFGHGEGMAKVNYSQFFFTIIE